MATEVGTAYVTLVPSARGFATKMQSQLGPEVSKAGTTAGTAYGTNMATSSSSKLKASAGKMFSVLKGAGIGAAIGAGFAIGHTLVDSITAASDLNETISKTKVVLGQASGAVLKWSEDTATSMGQSQQQALDAASTFAVFGKSAGLQGQDLSKFSTGFAGLASDMASFSNTTPDEAIQAIGAALRGESEPIRAYGVLLDDASMRQEALRLGLVKTTKDALTPQQRVLAAQSLIYKQTGDAQGDFARTSDGLANQQRVLSAQWDNMKTKIGQGLLPIVLSLVSGLNDLMPVISGFFTTFTTGGKSFGKTTGEMQGWLEDLKATFTDVIDIVTILWGTFGDDLIRFATTTFAAVKQIIGGALKVIRGIFKVFSSLLKGDWKGVWDGIKMILSGVLQVIKGLVKAWFGAIRLLFAVGWQIVKAVVGRAWDGIKAAVTAGINGLKSLVQSGMTWVVDQVKAVPGRIAALAGLFAQAGRGLMQGFINGLKAIGGFASDVGSAIWEAVKGMLNSAITSINAALDFDIDVGPKTFHVSAPDIPLLEGGARVTGATLAVIGEGREAETVLPDSLLRGLLERTAARGQGSVGELVITNWQDGTGYFRILASDVVGDHARFRRDVGAMHA